MASVYNIFILKSVSLAENNKKIVYQRNDKYFPSNLFLDRPPKTSLLPYPSYSFNFEENLFNYSYGFYTGGDQKLSLPKLKMNIYV